MTRNNKDFLLKQAQQLLGMLDAKDLETVQINSTKYDDLSEGLSIEITYPQKKETKKGPYVSSTTGGISKGISGFRINNGILETLGTDGEVLGGFGKNGDIIGKGEIRN